jgi:predicted metal-dependent peptidase
MHVNFSESLPTAGVMFDEKIKQFKLFINPDFLLKLSIAEGAAVLTHEIYHIFHKHVYYNHTQYNKMILNIAMDLVINQLIEDLPKEAMFLKNFKQKDGSPFPKNKPTEVYYDLLMNSDFNPNPDGDQSNPMPNEWKDTKEAFTKKQHAFDSHEWGETQDEAQLKEKLEAVQQLAKRAKEQTEKAHSKTPEFVEDLLEQINKELAKLDYKSILMHTLKRSMPAKTLIKTRKRPSRRFGEIAPGNKLGEMPRVYFLADTSGSISYNELSEFLNVTNGFMVNGVSKAEIGLFHTSLYHEERIKKNFTINESKLQSGGTELTDALTKVIKKNPDLLIILTDGEFSMPEIDTRKLPNTVVVLSNTHRDDCPLSTLKNVKTVKYGF